MISYANQYSIQAAGKDDHVNASQLNDMVIYIVRASRASCRQVRSKSNLLSWVTLLMVHVIRWHHWLKWSRTPVHHWPSSLCISVFQLCGVCEVDVGANGIRRISFW